jgi:hypothetical protein
MPPTAGNLRVTAARIAGLVGHQRTANALGLLQSLLVTTEEVIE